MEGTSAKQIPTPDELALLIDGIIQQRLLITIAQEESHLKLQQQKLAILAEKRRKRWQMVKQWGNLINCWTWAVVLMAVIFLLGVHTGLNLLPEGVVCKNRESFCYFLRFDTNKRILKR
ncbi:hypothetical protein [Gloeothece citriformis]|uniref:hypothetical protein n=1 Tax=Gloeothece citriformis TaxID=2546356 RepID=UPI0012FF434F|nr:hypothetical protein [Gloeothece citriformis]